MPTAAMLLAFLICAVPKQTAAERPPENTGAIDGKLTDLNSTPLRQAAVVLRNLDTGETARGVTQKNGSYHFTGLTPGEYRLEAELPKLGKGAVEGIVVCAGHATRVQSALFMELDAKPSGLPRPLETVAHELYPATPAVTTTIAAEELNAIPLGNRNWQAFAANTPSGNPAPPKAATHELDPVTPDVTMTISAEELIAIPLGSRNWQTLPAITPPGNPAPPEAEVHELDPVTPAVTTTIPSDELNAIPLGTRNWQAFAAITPSGNPVLEGGNNGGQIGNLNSDDSGDEGQALSLEGGSAYQTGGSIDGVTIPSSFRTASQRQSRATESIGESAVQSVEARTGNAPADAERGTGGSVNLITGQSTAKGQKGIHGQAFYLNRQSLWGAQNPLTQWVQQTTPVYGYQTAVFTAEPYSPAYGRQTFGLGLGSQLRHDKLFWFAALDGLLSSDPAVATVRHPDDFFAMPTLDELTALASRLELPGPAILENSAVAYSTWLNSLDELLGPVPRTTALIQGFGRVDRQITERHHFSADGYAAVVNAPSGALTRTSETYGSHSFGDSHASAAWGLAKWDSFLTANLLNAAGVEYRWSNQTDAPQSPSALEATLFANPTSPLPEIVSDSTNGFILGKPARLGTGSYPDERSFAAQDTVSWVHGANLVKAGASFDHIYDAVGTLVNQTGTYSYADVFNFVSDLATYPKFGPANPSSTGVQHNCDPTDRIYNRGGQDNLGGIGPLPCYASYSQRLGPANWHLSTNDLAAFVTEQWQPFHNLTISAGVRVEAEELPPTIATVSNPELPATQKLPPTTFDFGPRFALAWSPSKTTVLRAGAGLYYGRIDNSAVLAALTQTGSPYGDLNLFFKPTDNGAPGFPQVLIQPQTVVVPGAVSFASNFRPQEVDQAVVSIEQELPSHWLVSASALASLGRRLPISIDTNIDPTQGPGTITYAVVDALQAGPVKTPQITVPFYTGRINPLYQQLDSIESRANSTYDAAMIKLVRNGSHGLSLHAHYLYSRATDWNPNESGNVANNDILDPQDFNLEYGTSNLDIRHSAAFTLLYQTPWKLAHWEGALGNGWSVAAVGQYRSGLPFTMRTGGYIPGFYNDRSQLIEGVGPGMNGSAGDNRVYGIGRNTYRYPATWTGDSRLGKRFNLAHSREIELLAESFNLFNHQNVTLLETTGYTIRRGTEAGDLPTLNFLTGLTSQGLPSTIPEFGKPLEVNATNFYRPREFQLGIRARF